MSDWIQHDGARPSVPRGARVQVACAKGGITPGDGAMISCADWPGFYWRWRTVKTGLFKSEKRRVCDDPSYAPVIRYRIIKPRALLDLIELVENLPAPATPKVDA